MSTKPSRREKLRAATAEEIKTIARQHMARDGAAALSLRAVAAEMGMSSAAIYYYYANRDALITALIVDAFNGIGPGVAAFVSAEAELERQLPQLLLGYRAWALAHAAEFQLIFGTPIPGYHAPPEVTIPAARQSMLGFGELFLLAWQAGLLRLPAAELPSDPQLRAELQRWCEQTGNRYPVEVLAMLVEAWTLTHGLVSLELSGHLAPVVGEVGLFYRHEMRKLLVRFGLETPPDVWSEPTSA